MNRWTLRKERPRLTASELVPVKRERLADGYLVLVNGEHPVGGPAGPIVDLPDDLLRASHAEEPRIRLERTCLSLLSALLDACCGKESIAVVSGYRSRAHQERLYAESVREHGEAFTASYVARPGASEHQTGLAVDVGLYGPELDYIRPDFPDTGACGLFKHLAADYGFIQRYRDDKTHRTGIAAEPWHYRYVGFPHSAIIEREGLCLEEYTDYLREETSRETRLYVETSAASFEVYYVAADGDATQVPVPTGASGADWRLSGNNKDGFVVTAAMPGRLARHA